MITLNKYQLTELLNPHDTIEVLRMAFQSSCEVPTRNVYETSATAGSGMLLMPAWDYHGYLGVKIVTTTPGNRDRDMPFIQGVYLLFDQATGTPLLQLDAAILTNARTAAASALASSYLSHDESHTLLMVGAGSLAPWLIAAHRATRPIGKVLIWSRGFRSAEELASRLPNAQSVKNLRTAVEQAQIISCATPSTMPLIRGEWLKGGQHLDLVGGYTRDMRETDDGAVEKADIFVDTSDAWEEAGDLIQPMENGRIAKKDTIAELSDLCTGKHPGRTSHEQITLFKSVGHALEDIAVAAWVYETLPEPLP
ncbi:MAG: ornithine cyclodeaminase family protein [Saprospiraceae bacterium]|nr:ornithine cyclodeaminase family protein [Saprospiraceae bacterium]